MELTEYACEEGDSYAYEPLDSSAKQIRLLYTYVNDNGKLLWTMESYDLADAPRYCALSYEWGTESNKEKFYIDGKELWIRQNLAHFFRDVGTKRDACWWIDQICINQSAIDERNHQVSFMAEIYRSATAVSIWLGQANRNTRDLYHIVEACDRMGSVISGLESLGSASWSQTVDPFRLAPINPSQKPALELTPSCSQAFNDFFGRRYWRRLWPVQEVLLAKHITIFIGDEQFSWGVMRDLVMGLRDHSTSFSQKAKQSIQIPPSIEFLFDHAALSQSSPGSHVQYLFGDLIERFGFHSCTDRKDKLYGLSSLLD